MTFEISRKVRKPGPLGFRTMRTSLRVSNGRASARDRLTGCPGNLAAGEAGDALTVSARSLFVSPEGRSFLAAGVCRPCWADGATGAHCVACSSNTQKWDNPKVLMERRLQNKS